MVQDNPEQRQTIVDVICAYLRMPYERPGEPPGDDAEDRDVQRFELRVQVPSRPVRQAL